MIKRTPLIVAIILLATMPAAWAEVTAFVGARVFDATGRDPIPDAVVLVDGDRISAVGTRSDVPVPAGARIVDLSGKWVVPGLIDPHIHFFQSGGLYTRPDIVDLRHAQPYATEVGQIKGRLEETFRRYLASGITSVVDMGGPFWNFEVRKRARRSALAPRVAVAGPLVSTLARPRLDVGDPPIIRVADPEEARALVRRQLEHGPDLIKIWFIVTPDLGVEKTIDIVRATIDEAHGAGVRVAVHATQLETARQAVEAGADILVHSVDDRPVDQAFVELLKKRSVLYITTLGVYGGYAGVLGRKMSLTEIEERLGDPAAISSWDELPPAAPGSAEQKQTEARLEKFRTRVPVMKANLERLHEAGVIVAAGTDAGNIGTLHGPSFHRELELMAGSGLSPREVLITATRNAALVFAPKPEIGTLEPGKLADMLVLDADPLADIKNLRRIHAVVKGGELLEPPRILPPGPEEVVQGQVDAYNARNMEAFITFFAPDAVLASHPGGEIVARGEEEIRRLYGKLFHESPELHCTILKRIVSGDMVIDHELVTGLRGRPRVRAVAMYEVRDGLIRKVWFLAKE